MAGVKLYVAIWAGLVAATIAEVLTKSLPGAVTVLAFVILLISSAKAVTIALYYQHLRYEGIRTSILPLAAVVALVILAVSAGFALNMG